MTCTRPLLRYHGGKWRLAPWIIRHFPKHRIYVEPYAGAASVLLRKPRAYAEIVNDLDGELITLFRVVRDQGPELARRLHLTPFARAEYTAAQDPQPADDVETARAMVVRSLMGFGSDAVFRGRRSGFRGTADRSGTTPAHDWRNYPAKLVHIIERLRGVVIESRPALTVAEYYDAPEALIYADPPYVHSTRMPGGHGPSYTYEMTDDDHAAMIDRLKHLTGMVILSGYRCDLYDQRLRTWTRVDLNTVADGARPRLESLWLNPRADQALRRETLPLFDTPPAPPVPERPSPPARHSPAQRDDVGSLPPPEAP